MNIQYRKTKPETPAVSDLHYWIIRYESAFAIVIENLAPCFRSLVSPSLSLSRSLSLDMCVCVCVCVSHLQFQTRFFPPRLKSIDEPFACMA
jgi:hypothetical protein